MTTVAITGAGGFLGWHARAALRERGDAVATILLGQEFDERAAATALDGADRVLHLAGINRGDDHQVRDGNALLAEQLSRALRRSERPPRTIVYANSSQAGNGTVYGTAKERAAAALAEVAAEVGSELVDLRLPNLFGEHGRPFYNSVTATFCHVLSEGGIPEIRDDKELNLLHAQDAADVLIGNRPPDGLDVLYVRETVSRLRDRLAEQASLYRIGEIPDISSPFARDLFNTYRSFTVAKRAPIRLDRHTDARGAFFEVIRTHGGSGQSSFSTTLPGVTRGNHYHRRKVERFTVLSGRAAISLRRLFFEDVVVFEVSGDEPVAIDMPTMWSHNIVNTGSDELLTSFWTNDVFDAKSPDTIPEVV